MVTRVSEQNGEERSSPLEEMLEARKTRRSSGDDVAKKIREGTDAANETAAQEADGVSNAAGAVKTVTSVAKTTIQLGIKVAKEGTKSALKSNPWTMLVGAILDIVDAGATIVQTAAGASAAATRGKTQSAVEKIMAGTTNTAEQGIDAIDRIRTAGERIEAQAKAQKEGAEGDPEDEQPQA